MSSKTQTGTLSVQRNQSADADAAATSDVISTLRQQLRHREILEHPAVSTELRKLEEQLAAQLMASGRTPGRHRLPTAKQKSAHVIDGTPWLVSVE
jgi:hypothetical protein